MSRANMDKNPAEVAAMFDAVAKRYDLVNDILSLGQTKRWRKATTATIAPKPGMKILDLAAGTGSSSEPLHQAGADVIPEFSSPTFKPFRTIYINYLMKALPAIASKTSSNPDAYVYLAESIRAWPDQAALAARITQAGWSQVGWRNLSGGVVAVHRAINS